MNVHQTSSNLQERERTRIPFVSFDSAKLHRSPSKDTDPTASCRSDATSTSTFSGFAVDTDEGFTSWTGFEDNSVTSSIDGMTLNSETMERIVVNEHDDDDDDEEEDDETENKAHQEESLQRQKEEDDNEELDLGASVDEDEVMERTIVHADDDTFSTFSSIYIEEDYDEDDEKLLFHGPNTCGLRRIETGALNLEEILSFFRVED